VGTFFHTKHGELRRKNCNDLIEYIQEEKVIHVLTKILYSSTMTMSEQILIEEFSEAWKKYKARNVAIAQAGTT
jgi:hypothetical protein